MPSAFASIGPTGQRPAGQIFLSAAGMWPSTTAGSAANTLHESATNKVNYYTIDFADGSTLSCEGNLAMPSDWNGGTVTATFYWMASTDTTTNAVLWGCQGRSYGDGDLLDQAYGTQQTILDANASTALQLRISAATPPITITNAAASDLVSFRVQRIGGDASDTMAVGVAQLLGVMIGYVRA